jgi:purine-binding chemotaxis protein CheW
LLFEGKLFKIRLKIAIKMSDNPPSISKTNILVFRLDEQRYALALSAVERVVRAVEVTPWPEAAGPMLGLVNVQGQVIPVANLRRCLNLPERDIALSDRFIIARTAQQWVVLVVDEVNDVLTQAPALSRLAVEPGLPEMAYEDIVKLEDGMTPILNLDRLLRHDLRYFADTTRPTQ